MAKRTKEERLAELLAEVESKKIDELKRTNERLLRQIERLKDRNADLKESVYRAITDGINTLSLPKLKPPSKKKSQKATEEICVPLLSDIQLSKITPDYNTKIAEKRVEQYAQKIVELADLQSSFTSVKKCAVLALGDIVEGELIFPGQSHLIDASLYSQVTVDGPRILYKYFSTLLERFETVDVYWVIGNHGALGGRSRRDYDPETNADRMLGRILDTMFAGEKRIKFIVPDGQNDRNWYTVANLGKKAKFLCFHGDQIRGHAGIPWYGYNKKILGWKSLAANKLMEDFNYAVCGHYHTPTTMYINDTRVWVNGSTESYNTYALEQLASMGRPSQFCLFVKPDKGVTAEYLVNLEE
jgi:Icc-related predicted phosphoesterase